MEVIGISKKHNHYRLISPASLLGHFLGYHRNTLTVMQHRIQISCKIRGTISLILIHIQHK